LADRVLLSSILTQNQLVLLYGSLVKKIIMKKFFNLLAILFLFNAASFAQKARAKETSEGMKKISVPKPVKAALAKKYPGVFEVTWEKENGNYEANWGGKSGEDNSVQFTPSGEFLEMVKAISVKELPLPVATYVREHYKGAKIPEAGKVTDAHGIISYEAEVNRKDLHFDEKGNFLEIGN
jgi:Putative beta-lactamase-inhibitor-like, PepSY-like